MRRFLIPLSLVCLLTLSLQAQITVIAVPGAAATVPVSINNGGDVAGYFCPDVCFFPRGFVRESNGNTITFDGVPASINDAGTVAGYSYQTTQNFLRTRNGDVTVFDVPNTFAARSVSISDRGDVAGFLYPCIMCDISHGFVRDRQGTITTFVVPRDLVATSIHARGDITGHTAFTGFSLDGFVRDRNGTITMFDVPGASGTGEHGYAVSINNRGDVAGYFHAGLRYRGFVRARNGNVTTFDASPNASATISASINEKGDVAGYFTDATDFSSHDFLRTRDGNITVFDIPNAFGAATSVSINNRGDVAGYFNELENGAVVTHGFVRRAH